MPTFALDISGYVYRAFAMSALTIRSVLSKKSKEEDTRDGPGLKRYNRR